MSLRFSEFICVADDVQQSADWYRDRLGLAVVGVWDWGWGELLIDGVMLGLMRAGLWRHRAPMLSLKCDELDAEIARLRALGVEVVEPKGGRDAMRITDFADPDGNRIALWSDGSGAR